jgi:flavodoxin
MNENVKVKKEPVPVKSLVIVFSYHHKNTEKIAHAIADVLGAPVKTPQEVSPEEIAAYDLVGFGSGIYGGTLDASILDLADQLPQSVRTKAFIFSTYGAPSIAVTRDFVANNHAEIRGKLQLKGYNVLGEFGCAGWNTNSFLDYFGGINKGRPAADDILNAEAFALKMVERARE